MFNFNKKEDKFYVLLSKMGKYTNNGGILLRESLEALHDKDTHVKKIEDLEHKGDQLVHDIIKELNEAFITPIDREDIYAIVKEMDNILDSINSTIHRFVMFNINEGTEACKYLADKIVQATEEILGLIQELTLIGNKSNSINKRLKRIDEIEDEADILFRKTVEKLFKDETDALTVMKWKEIYQILENTIDTCERVGNIIEGVVMKNA
ncbi:DUF47 domain-containing protein [Clostridium sp. CTA-5]